MTDDELRELMATLCGTTPDNPPAALELLIELLSLQPRIAVGDVTREEWESIFDDPVRSEIREEMRARSGL